MSKHINQPKKTKAQQISEKADTKATATRRLKDRILQRAGSISPMNIGHGRPIPPAIGVSKLARPMNGISAKDLKALNAALDDLSRAISKVSNEVNATTKALQLDAEAA